MSIQSIENSKATNQRDLIEVRGDGNALQHFLEIHPPDDASNTPPILAFKRKREIEIPWSEIVGDEAVTSASVEATKAIRNYFEESWDFDVNEEWWKDSAHHLLETEPGSWYVKQLSNDYLTFRPNFDNLIDDKPAQEQLAEGFVIRHGTSGRLYRLIDPEQTLSEDHFKSWEKYEAAWQKHIEGVELVFETPDDAQTCYMDFEEIDLRPVIIQGKYEELRIVRDFAKRVKASVVGVMEKIIDQITGTDLDVDELEQLQRKVLRLEIGEYDAQRRIERLVSDAARLGYRLFIKDEPEKILYSDGRETILKPGKLYTTYRRTAFWTEYVSTKVPVTVGWWIFRRRVMKKVDVPHPKEQVVEDYQEVDTIKDIFAETRSAMIKGGQQVYVFEQSPSGLVSTEGEMLRQIMDRCKYDEAFRRSCVVMLPVYEDSLTGQRLLSKYAVYKRPLPGLVANILPRLSLEESLTYRTAWVETQLGELLNSINLAPDEERKVTITKRFEQETTVTRTSTSIFDISRAETSDLATEMENQTRQEQESSKSLQFSTKASGGWGAFSAEASASGGTSSSLKDMSQSISKVARKAAKSVSSQNREEVSTTATARTTISHTDETVATIRNINQGRSLNLMFYRLYNKYKGGLYLEGLRFDVIPSVEVIAGSGVHESKSYSLEELPSMIAEFKAAQLPFAIKDDEAYTNRLLERIETLLRTEYATDSGVEAPTLNALMAAPSDAPAESDVGAASVSVGRLTFLHYRAKAQTGRSEVGIKPKKLSAVEQRAEGAGFSDTDSNLAEFSEMLRRTIIHSDEPIAPQELLVAAPGLYLDAVVGAQPSTEPYSERMREQTVALKMAEVALTQADAHYRESLTQHLLRDGGNWIIDVVPGEEHNALTFVLKSPLAAGKWDFVLDGEKLCEVPADQLGSYIVNLQWKTRQKWLDGDGLVNRFVELQEREKGIVLRQV